MKYQPTIYGFINDNVEDLEIFWVTPTAPVNAKPPARNPAPNLSMI